MLCTRRLLSCQKSISSSATCGTNNIRDGYHQYQPWHPSPEPLRLVRVGSPVCGGPSRRKCSTMRRSWEQSARDVGMKRISSCHVITLTTSARHQAHP